MIQQHPDPKGSGCFNVGANYVRLYILLQCYIFSCKANPHPS